MVLNNYRNRGNTAGRTPGSGFSRFPGRRLFLPKCFYSRNKRIIADTVLHAKIDKKAIIQIENDEKISCRILLQISEIPTCKRIEKNRPKAEPKINNLKDDNNFPNSSVFFNLLNHSFDSIT